MRQRLLLALTTVVGAIALAIPATASAANEYGSTQKWPWSGYWWPMLDTNPNLYDTGGPLAKYDQYLGATTGTRGNSQNWEGANHSTTNAANSWWGHCHAWAAASILTTEPAANITKGGVTFTNEDTKGLVTELYYSPTYTWLSGRRVDDANDRSSAAYQDIAPAWMDYLLRYYVRYHKYPFIMDLNANSEVWNFPVFAFNRDTRDLGNGNTGVTTKVWFSSPTRNKRGTPDYISRTYTYTLRLSAQGGYLDTGSWTGDSVHNHPDFAWVPTGKAAPAHLSEAKVEEILGQNV